MFHTDKNKEKNKLWFSPPTAWKWYIPKQIRCMSQATKNIQLPPNSKRAYKFSVLADSHAILSHTIFYFFMKIMHSSYTRVHPFLLLSVLNITSESLKIQMLYNLWNVGAIFILETFKSLPRASWKAQAAHDASRDFQSPVLTRAWPHFASYTAARQSNCRAGIF